MLLSHAQRPLVESPLVFRDEEAVTFLISPRHAQERSARTRFADSALSFQNSPHRAAKRPETSSESMLACVGPLKPVLVINVIRSNAKVAAATQVISAWS